MSRCEAYNIAQVIKVPQLETKKNETKRSLTDDTETVSIKDIIKDLRWAWAYPCSYYLAITAS